MREEDRRKGFGMSAYYNEIDPFAVAWLRELIKAGHIADGVVDDRSITDVKADDVREFTQVHFFSGIDVWSYALRLAGWRDDRPVWTGSCPCQPFSAAGKGKGLDDHRHLWPEMFRLIRECRPVTCFGEQVANKAGETWFDIVRTDLEAEDYAAGLSVFPACGVGAPHLRKRTYWVAEDTLADPISQGLEGQPGNGNGINEPGRNEAHQAGPTAPGNEPCDPGPTNGYWGAPDWLYCRDGKWRPVESGTFPLADGSPARVGRLRGYGNAIVAEQAKAFIEAYCEIG